MVGFLSSWWAKVCCCLLASKVCMHCALRHFELLVFILTNIVKSVSAHPLHARNWLVENMLLPQDLPGQMAQCIVNSHHSEWMLCVWKASERSSVQSSTVKMQCEPSTRQGALRMHRHSPTLSLEASTQTETVKTEDSETRSTLCTCGLANWMRHAPTECQWCSDCAPKWQSSCTEAVRFTLKFPEFCMINPQGTAQKWHGICSHHPPTCCACPTAPVASHRAQKQCVSSWSSPNFARSSTHKERHRNTVGSAPTVLPHASHVQLLPLRVIWPCSQALRT